MIGMRRVFHFSTAVLAAFALASGTAFADKAYTLAISPTTGASPLTMSATFTDAGNSAFNSLTLTLPTGYTIMGTPTISTSKGNVSFSNGVITVTNIGVPVGAGSGETITVTMNSVATTTGTCGAGVSSNWTAAVYGGSSLNGALFSGNTPATTINPLCYNVTPSSSGNGTINPSTVQAVPANGTTSFTLAPATGYHIGSVGGTCGGTLSGSTLTTAAVTASCTVVANFAINTYTVTPSPGANGSMAPSTAQTVNYNSTTSFSVTPNAGYYTLSATGCGGSLSGITFTTGPITGNCTVTATFAPQTLSINSAPTSAAVNVPFNVTVGETPGGPTPTLGSDCGATATSSGNSTSTTFVVTIPTLPASGVCNITFSAPNYTSAMLSNFKVFKGVLDCGDYDSVNGPADHTYDPDLPSTIAGLGSSYVGTPGWGLRRGPNKDGSACVKVNYSCNLDATTNIAFCTYDKASGQLATFKYLFLWAPKPPEANGWTSYRPQVSWNVANPDSSFVLPDWVPLLACIEDEFPTLPTLPTTLLPVIPSVLPFTDPANTLPQYQPGVTALSCGAQQGWTAVGTPPNALLQVWDIVIDESDIQIKGP